MISSFFQMSSSPTRDKEQGITPKRARSPVDLTVSDAEVSRPSKKSKKGKGALFLPDSPSPQPTAGPSRPRTANRDAGLAEQWRFIPSSPLCESLQRSAEEEDSLSERHDRFVKKLLDDHSLLPRLDTGPTTDDLDEDTPACNAVEQSGESGDDSDSKFQALQELFSHKSKGKQKSKSKSKSKSGSTGVKMKIEEVGPSGQTYTALEQQVC